MAQPTHNNSGPGTGVDSRGEAVVDPTANVLSLVEAAVTRLDDLQREHVLRITELLVSELKRIESIVVLRAEYQEKLSIAESRRIDAIRAVDVAAVAIASERASQQATVLANQVSASAETLRSLVASTASQVAQSLQQVQTQLVDRIGLLEKSQYEIKGRSGVSDPMLNDAMTEIRTLLTTRASTEGRKEGMSTTVGYILAAIAAASAVVTIIRW